MMHVIIDRPRIGGDGGKSILPKGTKRRQNKIPLDEQPKFQSSARYRQYGWEAKKLNEHLSPLRRWLNKQVGRDWDEVWSEICKGLSVHNAIASHVRDHADQYVQKNCSIGEDGVVYNSIGHRVRNHRFYVDPRDNTLQRTPYITWKPYQKKKDYVPGKNNLHRYYCVKGIWYEVFFEEVKCTCGKMTKPSKYGTGSRLSPCDCKNYFDDVLQSPIVSIHELKRLYGLYMVAVSKKQLNKKEIKKLKLRSL